MVAQVVNSETRPNIKVPTFIGQKAFPKSSISMFELIVVFKPGKYTTSTIELKKRDSSAPPVPISVVSPNQTGSFPVLFFIHEFGVSSGSYYDIFKHIASHGIVVVSAEVTMMSYLPIELPELELAAYAANWLHKKLQCVVPDTVEVDLNKVMVSGHGRGGNTAFALTLGKSKTTLTLEFSALIGIDPVAGSSKFDLFDRKILTFKPNSFDIAMHTMTIGTGLGNDSLIPLIFPACAPNGVNHEEYYKECKINCTHFVIAHYGHTDMLNPVPFGSTRKGGNGDIKVMRRTLAGLVAAFIKLFVDREKLYDFALIYANPSLAPTRIYTVELKGYNSTVKFE